jgi:hypothetical protein
MLGDPRYQTEIMGDKHQREALPPPIAGQSHDHAGMYLSNQVTSRVR